MHHPAIALHVPRILLPAEGIDLKKWAVIACDQYTSQPEYWEKVAGIVGDAPSTLHMIYPEAYLEAADRRQRVDRINGTMGQYLDEGKLIELPPGFVLVDRQTPHAPSRKGLMVALDLEQYDYGDGGQTLIRSTEGTMVERLPPRIEVRRDAPLELPHIMVLIDDPQATVIEPLLDADLEGLYDVPLMTSGGRVRGWRVDGQALDRAVAALEGLARDSAVGGAAPLLYAMGDGNHSFATAKEVWEEVKRGGVAADSDHPARYALVELVNLHDDGLTFEPIHRVAFGVRADEVLGQMEAFFAAAGGRVELHESADPATWRRDCLDAGAADEHRLPFVAGGRCGVAVVKKPRHQLEVVSLQAFLDDYCAGRDDVRLDYIHGDRALEELGGQDGNIGFYARVIDKHALFRTIALDGALPRKSFSLGEPEEKRYYLEARRIR